jgi:RHS repeat-associated protein
VTSVDSNRHDYLDYMHARYYNPPLGRFLSVDPVLDVKKALRAPQMWNRYSYVTNNPILYNDPTGKIAATTAGIERDLKDRGLTDERDALVKYARTLSAQVKAGAVDSKKAVDMYWAKAKQLTGHVKYVGTADNALLVATGAALAIRGSVGNALTRGSMGQDTLHHFFFNAYNVNGGIPPSFQTFGSNLVLPTMREGRLTVESDALDRRANVLGAEFGYIAADPNQKPSSVQCPIGQGAMCQ